MIRYINRAYNSSSQYVFWTTDGSPDPSGSSSNAPAGPLTDHVVVGMRDITGALTEENLSTQVDGSATTFSTTNSYGSNTLRVYWNGQKLIRDIQFSETGSTSFSTTFTPDDGTYITVEYRKV
tara:strand:+ start:115 stop:483 length:369 start_codon:yes stop_codon:yes gene_type:complete